MNKFLIGVTTSILAVVLFFSFTTSIEAQSCTTLPTSCNPINSQQICNAGCFPPAVNCNAGVIGVSGSVTLQEAQDWCNNQCGSGFGCCEISLQGGYLARCWQLASVPTPAPGTPTPTDIPPIAGFSPTPDPDEALPYNPCRGLMRDVNDDGELDPTPEYNICTACQGDNGTYTGLGCISNDPTTFGNQVVELSFSVAGGITFVILLYGAFLCITSQGNPEKTQSCQQTITAAVVGMLLLIFSVFIVQILFRGTGGVFDNIIPTILFT